MGAAVTSLAFPVPPKSRYAEALLKRPDLLYLETENEDRIAAVHVRRGARGTDRVILYSHGNAEDLGQRLHYLDMMSQLCASDVLAYDYCGYGFSEGEPSEENCIQCIDAAYAYLLQHFAPNRIVLFGRSIGTGPTVDLAVRHPEIRGVILQSPIESCGRAVFGNLASWLGYRMDLFRNYEKVDKVECPVLVMHGTDDDIVPIESGMAIQEENCGASPHQTPCCGADRCIKACRKAVEPLWLEGYGHNDLPNEICLRRVREFMDQMDGLSWGWNIFVTNLATHISVNL
ncbi:Abhd17a [Symbiodinium sp. KB8]|nr:Abhd17a [Symbiodinium sp. KB8]